MKGRAKKSTSQNEGKKGTKESTGKKGTKESPTRVVQSEKTVGRTGTSVYILSVETWEHGTCEEDSYVWRILDSKEAAIECAGQYETQMGVCFDKVEEEFPGHLTIDNREKAPDDGILLQFGGKDVGEGDYETLSIKKCVLFGFVDSDAPRGSRASKRLKKSA
mmetsp:Transcript_50619/g.74033  ORF Transcript_50619/g.74033 Transcript_50619/m.74033 type:complete len:163 (+) Transcript_50619:91-579(+)